MFSIEDVDLIIPPARNPPAEEFAEISQEGILPISEKYHFGEWFLPGNGEAYADCGDLRFRGCLNTAGHSGSLEKPERQGKAFVQCYKRSCGRKECPICYEGWASLQADRAVYRLLNYCVSKDIVREVYRIKDRHIRHHKIEGIFRRARRKPVHVIFSIPKRLYSLTLVELKRIFYKLVKKAGIVGGCSIFHPFRMDALTNKWYFSPHFHVVGFGWVHSTKLIFDESGWIIKNRGVRKTVHGTLMYQLSHAGVHKHHHVTVWFGKLSYRSLYLEPMPELKPVCPLCGDELEELIFIGGEDRPPPEMVGDYWLEEGFWVAHSSYGSSFERF